MHFFPCARRAHVRAHGVRTEIRRWAPRRARNMQVGAKARSCARQGAPRCAEKRPGARQKSPGSAPGAPGSAQRRAHAARRLCALVGAQGRTLARPGAPWRAHGRTLARPRKKRGRQCGRTASASGRTASVLAAALFLGRARARQGAPFGRTLARPAPPAARFARRPPLLRAARGVLNKPRERFRTPARPRGVPPLGGRGVLN